MTFTVFNDNGKVHLEEEKHQQMYKEEMNTKKAALKMNLNHEDQTKIIYTTAYEATAVPNTSNAQDNDENNRQEWDKENFDYFRNIYVNDNTTATNTTTPLRRQPQQRYSHDQNLLSCPYPHSLDNCDGHSTKSSNKTLIPMHHILGTPITTNNKNQRNHIKNSLKSCSENPITGLSNCSYNNQYIPHQTKSTPFNKNTSSSKWNNQYDFMNFPPSTPLSDITSAFVDDSIDESSQYVQVYSEVVDDHELFVNQQEQQQEKEDVEECVLSHHLDKFRELEQNNDDALSLDVNSLYQNKSIHTNPLPTIKTLSSSSSQKSSSIIKPAFEVARDIIINEEKEGLSVTYNNLGEQKITIQTTTLREKDQKPTGSKTMMVAVPSSLQIKRKPMVEKSVNMQSKSSLLSLSSSYITINSAENCLSDSSLLSSGTLKVSDTVLQNKNSKLVAKNTTTNTSSNLLHLKNTHENLLKPERVLSSSSSSSLNNLRPYTTTATSSSSSRQNIIRKMR